RLFQAWGWQFARLPANRHRHHPHHTLRNDNCQCVGNARAPVVANHSEFAEMKCIREVDSVLCHRYYLTRTHCVLRHKGRITETSQIRRYSAKSRRVENGHHTIKGADIVRPTMQ